MTAGTASRMAAATAKFRVAVTGDYENFALKHAPWSTLGADTEVVAFTAPFESPQAAIAALRDFDAICLMRERTPLTRAIIDELPRLQFIVFTGPSNATLDQAAARDRNIPISSAIFMRQAAPAAEGGGSPSELTLALMLACAWRLPAADALIRKGGWAFQPGVPLRGKTLGIVGYGNLGKPVGRSARTLGMKVLAFSRSLTDESASAQGVIRADLDTLLRNSDVVSIHLPLTRETTGMIGAKEINLMKPGAFLINTARAAIVDQSAMIAALRTGRIAVAGLDVYDAEPLPKNHPLLTLPNVVMTPHIGYVTEESLTGMYTAVIDSLVAFRKGVIKNPYPPASR